MFRLTRSRLVWLSLSSLLGLMVCTFAFSWTRGAAAQGRALLASQSAVERPQPPQATEPELPNFDAFANSAKAQGRRTAAAAATQTSQFEGGHLVQMEPRLNVPTILWSSEALNQTVSASVPVRLRFSRSEVEGTARQHLQRYATRYRLSGKDVNGIAVSQVHDTGKGAVIVKFKQSFDGVEVFREQMAVVMNRQLELVALTGYVTGTEALDGSSLKFALPSSKAVTVALSDLSGAPVEAAALRADVAMNRARRETPYEYFQAAPNAQLKARPSEPVRSKKVLFHLVGQLVPAYYIEASLEVTTAANATESRSYAYVISALDGQMLYRKNLTAHDSFSYRVWADSSSQVPADGPLQDFTPHPTGIPNGINPGPVAPVLVTLQNYPFSFNDPWLPAGATETAGNNVDAYADLFGSDGLTAGDFRATTTAPGTFDRTYDVTQEPNASQDQQMAAITQLFYVTNFLHDWFYDYGFNEAAGNAQQDNFGRGGLGGDRMKVEAQDRGGINNANMNTPADGGQPRMQMYVWEAPSIATLTINGGPLAGSYLPGVADFGPQVFNISGTVVAATDGAGADPSDGCESLVGDYAGKIALISRGNCNFTVKVANAQAAGAVAVIITNNVAGLAPGLGGADPSITIPTLSVSQADGDALRAQLNNGPVTVTLLRQLQPRRDGTIDNLIVAHEWGHYIHHRLTNTGNPQGGSMSEGWGDFTALLMSVRGGDNFDGVYGMAPYAGRALTPNDQYFGIRRYPYSTDLTKNPLTFKHIQNGVALPAGVPTSGLGSSSNAEVHNAGEVWAVALWECYAALLKDSSRLTFAQAQDRMLSYVVAGYKLTPPDATFTEARDAILLAAYINDPVDFQLFTQAFAKRGMGFKAVAPDRYSSDHAGVVEDFNGNGGSLEYASAVLDDSIKSCDSDGVLDNGEIGKLTITLHNNGWSTLSNTTATISSSTLGVTFPNGPTINFPASNFNDTVTGSVNVQVSGLAGIQALTFNISYNDSGLTMPGPLMASYLVQANRDEVPNYSKTDEVESSNSVWTISHDATVGNAADWAREPNNPPNHVWHGPDVGSRSDHSLISPPLQVSNSGNFTLSFSHRFDFEADPTTDWDGGVIELSVDDGANWVDVGGLIGGADGYNGTITNPAANNPLLGRNVFSGRNASYPNFQTVTLNLGTTYAGQTVRLRFRIGTDLAAGAAGWDIDNLAFSGIDNMPFTQILAETTYCCPDITVTNPGVTTGTAGTFFSQSFTQSGGVGTTVFSTASPLPNGLLLGTSGVLSGTPTQTGSFPITVKATDSNNCMGTGATYTLVISCPTITVINPSTTTGTVGVFFSQSFTQTGGIGTISYSTASTLPNGLLLSTSGVLSGTPTQTGSFPITVQATDANGCMGTALYNLVIACAPITLPALPSGTVGTAYNHSAAASPAGTYSYGLTAGALPNGLQLDTQTGALSGTPTATGSFSFTLTATNTGTPACTASQAYTVVIACPTIAFAPASLPAATVNTAYAPTLSASPLGGSYTFALTSGTLPPGLTLNANGSFSGAPTQSGSYNFRVTTTGWGHCTGFRDYQLTVVCPTPTLSPASLPGGTVGTAYNQSVTASPAGTYHYSVTSGALPSGVALNSANGALTGTPTAAGVFSFTVTATVGTCAASQTYSITISCAPLNLTPTSLPGAQAGVAYSQTITAAGATSYSVLTGNLPPGLSLNGATGVLSGTATTVSNYSFTVQATAPGGCSGTQAFTLAVTCPTVTVNPTSLPAATVGTAYSHTLSATPNGNYSFSKTSGTLPPGLTLNSASGLLSGNPTTQGSYTFTVTATGFGTCAGSRSYTVTVGASCTAITLPALPATGKVGVNYYGNLATTTPSASYTFTVESGTLPPGLTIDNLFGALTGKPTAAGAFNFTLKATRSNGCTGTRAYSVTISSNAAALARVADYDGDGKSDPSLWSAPTGAWQIIRSASQQATQTAWGGAGDVTLLGDYDGDGQSDLAVYRPANGTWYVQRSSDGSALVKAWGGVTDVPVPGDYDGDGVTDVAVWRPSEGHWYVLKSGDGSYTVTAWGSGQTPYSDVPVPGDYDGDGRTDLAVFRRSTGTWLIQRSSDGQVMAQAWGGGTDVPVVGDYDGDGKADVAVWRGVTGEWLVLRSSDGGYEVTAWGAAWAGDLPVPGDYDGDGRTDLTVWRAPEGTWYVRQSTDAVLRTQAQDVGERAVPIR